ncbi:protein arginine methyltransferase NDUFAF7, mitochondrial isoform X2 [Scleropages formosus]|uniref:protein arginine methyltransferase NDUFAF7, mitochondrial isoform X2 n=1 Tax=Scleropages formosus TaxID=113540 RepID=UPI0010FA6F2A|nr:protein arginine methyltransferase NDUFAF7, mitochondrial isoform X2 [Scleropages formosus]
MMAVFKKLHRCIPKSSSFFRAPGLTAVRCRERRSERSAATSASPPRDAFTGHAMLRHLTSKIKATGPISVAEYMREVLTNPVSGYYVRHDMLGTDGDFITSPEISQIFGELLGIWCVSEWMAAGKPRRFQLVELGPGRGSLISDVLRVFSQLRTVLSGTSVSVHLVEISPKLSKVQAHNLTGEQNQVSSDKNATVYRRGTTMSGLPVCWYHRVEDIPEGFSIFLAHEFFDALPIHKFQRTERGWREVMVDIDPEEQDKLCFVLVPAPTLASSVLLQGFRGHKLHDVLSAPGTADLTADVDFSYLRRMAGDEVVCFGPITQRQFLRNMGIDVRLQVLLQNCPDDSTRAQLIQGFDMLTNPKQMGERFKFFAMLAHGRLLRPAAGQGTAKKAPAPLPVAGFTELGPLGERS